MKQIFAVRDNAVPVSRGCSRIHTRARQQYSTDLRPMAYCTDLFLYRPLLGSSLHILPPGSWEHGWRLVNHGYVQRILYCHGLVLYEGYTTKSLSYLIMRAEVIAILVALVSSVYSFSLGLSELLRQFAWCSQCSYFSLSFCL